MRLLLVLLLLACGSEPVPKKPSVYVPPVYVGNLALTEGQRLFINPFDGIDRPDCLENRLDDPNWKACATAAYALEYGMLYDSNDPNAQWVMSLAPGVYPRPEGEERVCGDKDNPCKSIFD